ncbi:hypothetical protein GOB93_19875 [Acetobacter musti]|uniref:Conjugal transfer protein TraD n=1 Tax=Acetobacter musti TaxID=864732 RepID=A0ABX0JVI8_9PROT|nr:hypothetical protein [Acetobacter musti]NHN86839.1 hypothetical protein [Acetobacter musti]
MSTGTASKSARKPRQTDGLTPMQRAQRAMEKAAKMMENAKSKQALFEKKQLQRRKFLLGEMIDGVLKTRPQTGDLIGALALKLPDADQSLFSTEIELYRRNKETKTS